LVEIAAHCVQGGQRAADRRLELWLDGVAQERSIASSTGVGPK
jgi:hypothetical protein